MEKRKDRMTVKCLTCKDEYCSKSLLNKLYCAVFVTKRLGKSFIKAVGLLLIVVLVPIVINTAYMIGAETQNTIFSGYHLLTYAGACIFGLAVYWQTRKTNRKNQEIQERSLRLEDDNLRYNTFVYLKVLRIETTADFYPVKTYELDKPVPWPLDAILTPVGYPNGIPENFPRKWKKQLEKSRKQEIAFRQNPINSLEYKEFEVMEKVFFGYKTESGSNHPCIDPYEGIFYTGGNPELVLWQKNFPVPRYYRYYTEINLDFFAKSSREDFFVDIVEIENFHLTLETSGKMLYRFSDNLSYFADTIRKPFILKPTAIAKDSYFGKNYDCDHVFSFKLHLCHDYTDLLGITAFSGFDIKFDATYINTFGVRTKRKQGFRIGGVSKEVRESQMLGVDGKPLKYSINKKIDLQHYYASDVKIEVSRTEYHDG